MTESLPILIADDETAVARALGRLLESRGFTVRLVATPAEALEVIRSSTVGVLLSDMNFSPNSIDGEEGRALFRAARAMDPELPVVLLTAWASLETAVALVREGAADYQEKPWDADKLVATLKTLLELRRTRQQNRQLLAERDLEFEELRRRFDLGDMHYKSPAMHRAVALAAQVARSDAPVLITGENGVGKEVIADVIQRNSSVKEGPFVKVNSGALPADLLEAELFGAEAGAYTGAQKAREGRFEIADGGTLFLDEVGNVSPRGQAALLRVLQTGEFERLGSTKTRKVHVRLLSATNADLPAAIAAGQFREDLYYRLNVIEVRVPPLRDRREDLLLLLRHFLDRYRNEGDARERPPLQIADDVESAVLAWGWPGNVRELQNRARRAAIVCTGDVVRAEDLDLDTKQATLETAAGGSNKKQGATQKAPADIDDEPPAMAGLSPAEEARKIQDALARAGGVIARAASELGLSRQALYRRIHRLGLDPDRRFRTES